MRAYLRDATCCHRYWPVCLLDNLAHDLWQHDPCRSEAPLPRPFRWICDLHDRLITGATR